MENIELPEDSGLTPKSATAIIGPLVESETKSFTSHPEIHDYSPRVNDFLFAAEVDTVAVRYPALYLAVKKDVELAVQSRESGHDYRSAIQLLEGVENGLNVLSETGNHSAEEIGRTRAVVNSHKGLTYMLAGMDIQARDAFEDALKASLKYASLPSLAEVLRHQSTLESVRDEFPNLAVPFAIEGRQIALFLGRGDQNWFDGGVIAALYDSRIRHPLLLKTFASQTKFLVRNLGHEDKAARKAWIRQWCGNALRVARFLDPTYAN